MAAPSPRVLVLVVLLLGAVLTLSNRELPLVRNSLVYARASEHVIEHGYDPRPVVADSQLSYDKPILYAWASAPFVAWLGNHDGLRLTSFLTTAAYVLALLHFARSFRELLPSGGAALLVALGAFGPCVFYQFWSAHPDGWFAGLAVLAWSLTHRIVAETNADPVPRVVALGLTLLVAVLLKNYGLVLLLSCPLYLGWHRRALRADRTRWRRLLASVAVVFALLGLFVWLAWTGHNPLSRLEGEGGGVGQYATGELATSARGACVGLGLALLLQFHVALLFCIGRGAWAREMRAPLLCFGAPYVLGLMPFPTTFYNMRYFVPLFALAALVLARGAADFAPGMRRKIAIAHGAFAALLVLLFNWAPAYRAGEPYLPDLTVKWYRGVPLSLLDNLRMEQHLAQAAVLDDIEHNVPPGATLYFLDAFYYRDAQQGVFEHAGFIRSDIATHYASSRDFHPAEPEFYVSASRSAALEPLGEVTELAPGLFRVTSG